MKEKESTQNSIKELKGLLEQKNRELEIEAALERVRVRAMAMHKSEELSEVAVLLYQELTGLGLTQFFNCGYVEVDEIANMQYVWVSTFEGAQAESHSIPLTGDPVFDSRYKAWKRQDQIFNQKVGGSTLKKHFEFTSLSKKIQDTVIINFPDPVVFYCANFHKGYLHLIADTYIGDAEETILVRFAKVFEQTYTRFLDLQKAEAQAREAQIEAALERIRSRTMGMHNSSEIGEIVSQMYVEFEGLDIEYDNVYLQTDFNSETRTGNIWFASEDQKHARVFHFTPFKNPILERFHKAFRTGETFYMESYSKKIKDIFFKEFVKHTSFPNYTDELTEMVIGFPGITRSVVCLKNSQLFITRFSFKEFTVEENSIFIRLGKLFEQSYARFLDLQKAEEQAREAQIEAALERVRARTMAMQHSDELAKTALLMFEQLQTFGVELWSCGFNIWNKEEKICTSWMSSKGVLLPLLQIPLTENIAFIHFYESRQRGDSLFIDDLSGEVLENHYQYMRTLPGIKKVIEVFAKEGLTLPTRQINHLINFSHGNLLFRTLEPCPQMHEIFKRFAKVFEQTYTRFLDLQKAEAQVREAQIETALEKVRSRSLAMHKSDEVQEIVNIVFQNLKDLNIQTDVTSVIILKDNMYEMDYWVANSDNIFSTMFRINHNNDIRILRDVMISRKSGVDFSKSYSYDAKNELWKYLFEHSDLTNLPDERKKFVYSTKAYTTSVSFTKNAAVQLNRYYDKPFTENENEILKRFAAVFEQAYVRFLDLKKAEAQAREAIKQASLDRIRGEIASMRTKDDLNKITPLIWKELTALEVPFIRCGVFIMNQSREIIQTYLSKPDGESLSAFEMSYHDGGIATGAVKSWKKNEIFHEHWDKNEFVDFMQNLIKEDKVDNAESFQGGDAPPESLYLNFVPFKQGMLYVGNNSSLANEKLDLVKSLAEAFSIAYARYEDFNQLEEAKIQTEKTLNELKAAQSQLIQSEKMASLGELTAGIAHEIQNPLNFVNNFSELSIDLLEEMEEEMTNGNTEEVIEITSDIKQNLDKINQHGKRASSIVKGMLEHSRTSTNQKELTNINTLADEYLRLTYHGLRAKDKSFNADFKLQLDENLPKINVIPQDIGRVLLNLINNAFYACAERSRSAVDKKEKPPQPTEGGAKNVPNDYKPIVTISTSSFKSPSGGVWVKVSVTDNGGGIPESIKEKIFQPFFTTKPTGSGTGLGLSLSYDIITKGHNGHLEVKTEESIGTEFLITLPTN